MASRNQIGNLLVEAGIISPKTLERALVLQKKNGKRLGMLLREIGIVTEDEVMAALAKQCGLKTARNFAEFPFTKELLDLVPAPLAVEKLVFPLKQHQGMLAIATLDPFDHDTFDRLAQLTGMKIYPVLATRHDVSAAIKKHYLRGKWPETGRRKVLLLDPSPIVTKMCEPELAREGYEVLAGCDGMDGLKLAFSRHPDLVVCDLMMPRLDAYNILHALRAHPETAAIPVILMSSRVSVEEERRALKAGFLDFIGKPAMPVRVLARVKKAFMDLAAAGQTDRRAPQPTRLRDIPPWERRRALRGH